MLSGWPILAALAVCGVVAVVVLGVRRQAAGRVRADRLARLRLTPAEIGSLSDREFEFTLRDLLIRDGWSARQVGRQGILRAEHPCEQGSGGASAAIRYRAVARSGTMLGWTRTARTRRSPSVTASPPTAPKPGRSPRRCTAPTSP
ncbi:hypothetical protein GCM10009760_36010 [Kitasatospora kazusensis]|uniref:Restriction endonuclease n=1 Tax=Kitasatospora kazusensis TaxID=407974 RepID=A0ABN2ZRF8_9ACTN